MKTLYFDCQMGAAGDMLTAALLELVEDKEAFINEMNNCGIPGIVFTAETVNKCGITGTHVSVKVNGVEESEDMHHHEHDHIHEHHSHNSLHNIEHLVKDHMNIPESVKEDVINVYKIIANAESHVHGVEVNDIHFHEVGTMDAVADVTAVCMLMHKIAADKIIVSPIHVGSGQVKCAHGIMPVPAPATAHILQNVPTYGGKINGELCTPTGAALLKYFADDFASMPNMITNNIGYGMGKKDFEAANCIRAMVGEEFEEAKNDRVCELKCNIDDMTGEQLGFAMEMILAEGALDVYTIPIGMKKSRPATMLCVLCKMDVKKQICECIFKHTTTIGIRESLCDRYVLSRRTEKVTTKYGDINVKISEGYGVIRKKAEYEDLAQCAKNNNVSIKAVEEQVYIKQE